MALHHIDVSDGSRLIFGMQWQALVDAKAKSAARKVASARKATHYLLSIDGSRVSESLGTVVLKGPAKLPKGMAAYSAAQAFARQHPQGIVCLVARLTDELVWLVAARAGNVLAKTDIVTSEAEALEIVEELQQRHGEVLTLVHAAALDDVSVDDLAQHLNDQTRLVQLGFSLSSVPKPFVIGFWILVALIGAREAHTHWRKYDDARRLRELSAMGVDPQLAWAEALENFTRANPMTSPVAFSGVIASILDVPLRIDRWKLKRTDCQSAGGQWLCSAEYVRGPLGTSQAFDAARPKHWRVSWSPLNRAVATFTVQGGFNPIDLKTLPELKTVESETITRLQRIEPAFLSIVTKPPVPVPVPPPTNDAGQVVPLPQGGLQLKEVDVAFSGPLRSALLIDDEISRRIAWKNVSVQVAENAEVGLKASQLVAQLKGTIYAK